jgi:hypothetical protein
MVNLALVAEMLSEDARPEDVEDDFTAPDDSRVWLFRGPLPTTYLSEWEDLDVETREAFLSARGAIIRWNAWGKLQEAELFGTEEEAAREFAYDLDAVEDTFGKRGIAWDREWRP